MTTQTKPPRAGAARAREALDGVDVSLIPHVGLQHLVELLSGEDERAKWFQRGWEAAKERSTYRDPLTPEQREALEKLREPFPVEVIEKRPQIICPECSQNRQTKNCARHDKITCRVCGQRVTEAHKHLDYVGHASATNRLLEVDLAWDWEPIALTSDGLPMLDAQGGLWITLTVAGMTRKGYGDATGKAPSTTATKEIIGDAIRNAGMRFGMALDLWSTANLHMDPPHPAEPFMQRIKDSAVWVSPEWLQGVRRDAEAADQLGFEVPGGAGTTLADVIDGQLERLAERERSYAAERLRREEERAAAAAQVAAEHSIKQQAAKNGGEPPQPPAQEAKRTPGDAPVSGEQLPVGFALGTLITTAFRTGDPARLEALRTEYGLAHLRQTMVPDRERRPVPADAAITRALAILAERSAGEKKPGQDPPAQCERPDCPTPREDVRPYPGGLLCATHSPGADARRTRAEKAIPDESLPEPPAGEDEEPYGPDGEDTEGAQPPAGREEDPWETEPRVTPPARTAHAAPARGAGAARAVLLAEAEAQARILGTTIGEHLAPLLAPGTLPEDITATRLKVHVVNHRVPVCQVLTRAGHQSAANAYLSLGKQVTEAAVQILEQPLEEYED